MDFLGDIAGINQLLFEMAAVVFSFSLYNGKFNLAKQLYNLKGFNPTNSFLR
jgi:hypothetical protein